MAEYSANALQLVNPGESVIFTGNPVRPARGLVYHRDESGVFRLASPSVVGYPGIFGCGCCGQMPEFVFDVFFHANIAIPTGGTVDATGISLAVVTDGETDPSSTMISTPAAVEEFNLVSAGIEVSVPWICRCAQISVRNTSTQPINVQNANLLINFRGIR